MTYRQEIEETKRVVEALKQLAPDLKTGDYTLAEVESTIAKGEAEEVRSDNLRGQVSACVVVKYEIVQSLREQRNGILHGIRSSKHPRRDEILRFLGYKMPWEFGGESEESIAPPPSGQAPLAA